MSKARELSELADVVTVDGSTGNVGIGTTSPSFGDSAQGLEVKRSGGNVSVRVNYDGSAQGQFTATNSSIKLETRTAGIPLVFGTEAAERMRIDSSGNVGIGDIAPNAPLVVHVDTNANFAVQNVANQVQLQSINDAKNAFTSLDIAGNPIIFSAGGAESARIDASGNLLVGTTASTFADAGVVLKNDGLTTITRDGSRPLAINRLTSDGDIVEFYKDGSTVGSIGIRSGVTSYIVFDPRTGGTGLSGGTGQILPTNTSGVATDNFADLGASTVRFNDIYATNGTIQTSDRNEKEAIASLTATEMLVAARLSSSFKNFKWKDAVADKGADARIHSGVIAQDVQAAFAAVGLDAGDYAMFISSTWWEHSVDVPAVDAVAEVLDADGNVVTEAVDAVAAYTRVDTYETLAEAPAGSVERTRMGVRYPELLAFVAAYNDQRFASIEARLTALEAV